MHAYTPVATSPDVRHDWGIDEIVAIYNLPLLELVGRANALHRRYHDPNDIQKANLLSIKTGGCPEDCNRHITARSSSIASI